MKECRTLLWIVLLMVNANEASAQFEHFYESWRWAQFTTATGLPSNIVDDIVETDDGIVWASTYAGLAWYDGFRWNKILEKDGLPEKHPSRLYKGHNNTVMVIIDAKLYIGNRNSFNLVLLNEFASNIVGSACLFGKDSVLIAIDNAKTPFILLIDGKLDTINLGMGGTLYETRNKKIYLSNSQGLFSIKYLDKIKILEHCYLRAIIDNTRGETIMAADSPYKMMGIWEWRGNDLPQSSKRIRYFPIRTMDISSRGIVIAVYETGEIHIKETSQWKKLKPVPNQLKSVKYIKYDSRDNLWICTEEGLFYFNNSKNMWKWWRDPNNNFRNIVMEICEYKNTVWIGTADGLEIHNQDSSVKYISQVNNVKLGLITGINVDNKDNIWISSGQSFDGSFMWDGVKWKHFGTNEGLNSPRVHKIKKDKKGQLWFLGLGEDGSIQGGERKDPGAFVFTGRYFNQINTTNGLLNNRVYSFAESRDGSLWFGTKKGLSRKSTNGWKHYDGSNIQNLLSVYTVAVDSQNNIWFSNFTSQLYYIDQNDSVHREWDWLSGTDYRQKVWDIKVDSKGIVWVATTRGLFSYFNGSWNSYDFEADFKLKELRVVLPLDDKIYVGGHGIGVGILERNEIGYPIKAILQEPIIETDKVRIRWTVDSFWGSMPSENIDVRYQLDDYKWSDWIRIREVVFEGLEDGDHSFVLQAKDVYGNIQVIHESAVFNVPPPYYKSPKYYIPFLLFLVGIIFISYKNARQRMWNKLEIHNQRIRIADDLHDDVGSNLGSIALMSQRIGRNASISEEIKEEITNIFEIATQSGEYLRDIVWFITPRNDNFKSVELKLRSIAARMLKGIELDFQVHNEVKEADISEDRRREMVLMFKEMMHNILKHSNATKVNIRIDYTPNHLLLCVEDNGIGFDKNKEHEGNGMHSLKKRAENADAHLDIKTQIGQGAAFTVTFKNMVTR